MKRMQSAVVLAILGLSILAGVMVGTAGIEPARYTDPVHAMEHATPEVPKGHWRY